MINIRQIKHSFFVLILLSAALCLFGCTKTRRAPITPVVDLPPGLFIILPAHDNLSDNQRNVINSQVYLDLCDKEIQRLFINPKYDIVSGNQTEIWLNDLGITTRPIQINHIDTKLKVTGSNSADAGQKLGDYVIQLSGLELNIQDNKVSNKMKLEAYDLKKQTVAFAETESRSVQNDDPDQAITTAIRETIRMLGYSLQSRLNLELNFSKETTVSAITIYKPENPPESKSEPVTDENKEKISEKPKEEVFLVEFYPTAPKMETSCRGNLLVSEREISFKDRCGEFHADPQKMTSKDIGESSVITAKGEKTVFIKSQGKLYYVIPVDNIGIPQSSKKILNSLKALFASDTSGK